VREIARRLGVSRNTVTRYLASEEVPRYRQRVSSDNYIFR
jgi:AcrR family transcriptional regulator